MAEIKIEKKKPIWPWIILVLVILALLYFLVFADDEGDEVEDVKETEQIETAPGVEQKEGTTAWETTNDTLGGAGVSSFIAYISDKSRMGVDHEYTNNALIQLMNAVQVKADEIGYDIETEMEEVRQYAQAIQSDPQSKKHANKIKEAGTKLAEILQGMQEENFPDLAQEVDELSTAAENIDGSVPTLEQKDQINKFFKQAGEVLQQMS